MCKVAHTHYSRLKFKAFAKTLFSDREIVELYLKSDLFFINLARVALLFKDIRTIKYSVCRQKVVLSIIGMGMVPSMIDVWGYDREFCLSSMPLF